jgi:hypothetical protein
MPTDDADPLEWYQRLAGGLLSSPTVHRGEWQSMDVTQSAMHETYEALGTQISMLIPETVDELRKITEPNLPWADEHFAERVGGVPVNPPPSHKHWPWARHNANHQDGIEEKFSHTYPERFWPKAASDEYTVMHGIRYRYGDLEDVVTLLVNRHLTRQAFLPVWFPEDTGAVHGKRVPCTIGYHFIVRGGYLHCFYPMRSCDFVRHLRDDVYLAGRLMQWMCEQVNKRKLDSLTDVPTEHPFIDPGRLEMTISSLHAFIGDRWKLQQIEKGIMS